MRRSSNKNFKYMEEIISEEHKPTLRNKIREIQIKENITIFSFPPGFGKTFTIIDFIIQKIKNEIEFNKKIEERNINGKYQKKILRTTFGVYTKTHKLIRDEYLPSLEEYGAAHIKGVTYPDPDTGEYMCPDPKMLEMHKMIRKIKIVCGKICKKSKDECPYFQQNKKAQIVLMPVDALKGNERKNYVIVDENISETRTITKQYEAARLLGNDFQKALKDNDAKWLQSNQYKKDHIQKRYNQFLDAFIENKDWDKVALLCNMNIDEQIFLAKNKIEVWYRPKLYDVFDIASKYPNTKIILLCATFNKEYFTDMLKSYSGEIGIHRSKVVTEKKIIKVFKKNLKELITKEKIENCYEEIEKNIRRTEKEEGFISVKNYTASTSNKDTIVYHINSQFNYRQAPPHNIEHVLENVHHHFPDVGLICDKSLYEKIGWGLYYGSAAGSNNYEASDVLIKINEYVGNIIGLLREYQQQYMDFDFPKMPNFGKKNDTEGLINWIKKHSGNKCNKFMSWKNEAINYDSIHRNRGLWSKESLYPYNHFKIIIIFGAIPKQVYNEFTVIEERIENKDLRLKILEIIQETKKKNKAYEEMLQKQAEEILKQYIVEEPKTEEEYFNIPEHEEYEPQEDIQEIPEEIEPEFENDNILSEIDE